MVEIDEDERVEFGSLKEQMPDYAEICEFFYKMNHGLIEDLDQGSQAFSDEQGVPFNPNMN